MKINFKFSLKNLLIAIAIFLVEVLIATKLEDWFFVRAYLGDVFVVMLMYYFIKAFFVIGNASVFHDLENVSLASGLRSRSLY